MSDSGSSVVESPFTLSTTGKYVIIVAAFLGWFFGGMHMAITSLAMGSAAEDLLVRTGYGVVTEGDRTSAAKFLDISDTDGDGRLNPEEASAAGYSRPEGESSDLSREDLIEHYRRSRLDAAGSKWFGFYTCAFLFGAALGGLIFGRIGDQYGRVIGMGGSILVYSAVSLVAYFVRSPEELWIARFVVCMGVGGMWPNGVALMSEAWAGVSRPMLAGVIGTSANVGIFLTSLVARNFHITVESWRWVMLMGGGPIVLAVFVFLCVPESPKWLARRKGLSPATPHTDQTANSRAEVSTWDVFKPPLLGVTLGGILLATVPLLGGWGSANWAMNWADQVGREIGEPGLKADAGMARSLTGIIGSLLGGWVASVVGRRLSYFIASVVALGSAQYLFWMLSPEQPSFLVWFAILGLFSGFYFGWLPLFLPELFETRIRSTGAGVCFNFGRIITAITVFVTALLITAFDNDYSRIGRVTSLIYLLGAIGICLVPKHVGGEIKD
ncbi:MAG: MFS transporter [Planctomycetota bacterium]|nr:MFS transporter [Planctomycetota bacterium]MDA1251348.1 MFS transporter [Planctomycetota bacterium]